MFLCELAFVMQKPLPRTYSIVHIFSDRYVIKNTLPALGLPARACYGAKRAKTLTRSPKSL